MAKPKTTLKYDNEVARALHALGEQGCCDDIYESPSGDVAYITYEPASVMLDLIEIANILECPISIRDLFTLKEAAGCVVLTNAENVVLVEIYKSEREMEKRTDEIAKAGESIMADELEDPDPITKFVRGAAKDVDPLEAAMRGGKTSFTLNELREMSDRKTNAPTRNSGESALDQLDRLVNNPQPASAIDALTIAMQTPTKKAL